MSSNDPTGGDSGSAHVAAAVSGQGEIIAGLAGEAIAQEGSNQVLAEASSQTAQTSSSTLQRASKDCMAR